MILFISLFGLPADKVPDFSLRDFDGVYYNLYDALKEGPVVLDFWATWCKPCLKSMPMLDSLYRKYKKSHLQVFGICLDTKGSIARAKSLWNTKKLSYTPLWDWKGEVQKKYGIISLPTFIIIDGEGRIVLEKKGYTKKERGEIEDSLRAVLIRFILEKAKKRAIKQ